MKVELGRNTRKSRINWDEVTELSVYDGKHNVPHCPKLAKLNVYRAELIIPGPLNLHSLWVANGGKVSGMWHSHKPMGWWYHYLTFWINGGKPTYVKYGRLMACTGCFNGTVEELLDPKAARHRPTADHPKRWLADYRRAAEQAERDFRAAGYQFTV